MKWIDRLKGLMEQQRDSERQDVDAVQPDHGQIELGHVHGANVNGTLEVLLHKVDKIEESQGMILRKVEGLHAAIYDPDAGLFSRIKESAAAAASRDVELDQKAKQSAERLEDLAKVAAIDAERHKSLDASITKIDDLIRWKVAATRVVKYVLLAVLTSVGGFLAKLTFDWIQGHVKLV